MIKNIPEKKKEILETLKNKIHTIDENYRSGKPLTKYKTVLENRKSEKDVRKYLLNENNVSDIYKTLEAWDMNKRGAKLRKVSEIKQSFEENIDCFIELEKMGADILEINLEKIKPILEKLYNKLHIMESKAKLVSFSKTLHFIFPNLFMPMDRKNTLNYFYSNFMDESFDKYYKILSFSYHLNFSRKL